MSENYYSEINELGVVTPLRDLNAVPWSSYAVTGAYNFLPIKLSVLKGRLTTGWTWNSNAVSKDGITFTFTVDGDLVTGIDVDGTSTAQVDLPIYDETNGTAFYNTIKGKTLILSGMPTSVSDKLKLNFWCNDTGNKDDEGSGVSIDFPSSVPSAWNLKIRVYNGKTLSHIKVYPMVSYHGGASVPYAMTNEELAKQFILEKVDPVPADSNEITDNHVSFTKMGSIGIWNGYFTLANDVASGTMLFTLPNTFPDWLGIRYDFRPFQYASAFEDATAVGGFKWINHSLQCDGAVKAGTYGINLVSFLH